MKIKGFVITFLIFLVSCKTVKEVYDEFDNSNKVIDSAYPGRIPIQYPQHEKGCTEDKAIKDVGFARIHIEGKNGKENLRFDFSGVSGRGLVSKDGLGVVQGYVWEGIYENCKFLDANKSAFSCNGYRENVDPGKPVLLCNIPSDGYPIDSIENGALVAMSAYLTTVRFDSLAIDKHPSRSIGFLLFPTFRRIFMMQDGSKEVRYDVDNARWTNRKREGGWLYTMDLLPTSGWRTTEYARVGVPLKEYHLQTGVISHEVFHHIFAFRASKLKQFGYKLNAVMDSDEPTFVSFLDSSEGRSVGMQLNVSAMDESIADLGSHLAYNSSLSPYYGFQLDRTLEARRVRASQVSTGGKEKELTEPLLRHFYSKKRSFPPQNSFSPDHQDTHAVGAILANALDQLFGEKFGEKSDHPKSLEKYKLVMTWVNRIQELFVKNKDFYSKMPAGGYSSQKGSGEDYETGPAMFLQDAVWEAVKLAFVDVDTLTREQCTILKAKFPVYVLDWEGKYHCR